MCGRRRVKVCRMGLGCWKNLLIREECMELVLIWGEFLVAGIAMERLGAGKTAMNNPEFHCFDGLAYSQECSLDHDLVLLAQAFPWEFHT